MRPRRLQRACELSRCSEGQSLLVLPARSLVVVLNFHCSMPLALKGLCYSSAC